MVERILALDPGGTTGWALWKDDRKQPDGVFSTGHIGPKEHHETLWNQLNFLFGADPKLTVVCESFEFRQHDDFRTGVELISKEYIGIVKLFGRTTGTPVIFQTAGQAKSFIPDKARNGLAANEKLKVIGLYEPGKKHAMDAMRHLILYMVTKRNRIDLVEAWKDLV